MAETFATGNTRNVRIAVVGGGVIGLACALELRRRGAEVCVYDKASAPAAGASGRAAGILGGAFEARGPSAMHRLMLRSGRAWRSYADRVERLGGGDIGYSGLPSIVCGMTIADVEGLLDTISLMSRGMRKDPGLTALFYDGDKIREIEPAITGPVMKAGLLLQDRQVDAGLLTERLAIAVKASGGEVRYGEAVSRIECGAAFRTPDGREWDQVLVATGVGRPPVFVRKGDAVETGLPPIVPVKGQMLALKPWDGAPTHVIRLKDVYIVPKKRWVLVGATHEPGKSDHEVEPEALARLRAAAAEAVGGVAGAEQATAWAGVRPGTKDEMPLIGETAIPGVFAAMGHYRNGILLAPETAKMIADQMLERAVSREAAAFSPLRFDKADAPSHSP